MERRRAVEITKETYDKTAEQYAKNVEKIILKEDIGIFLNRIPKGGSILDLGCGSGRDARIFSERGYAVVGLDYSENMVKIARKTAPLAEIVQGDMRDFDLKRMFNGVWIVSSLLHIPREEIYLVQRNIFNHLYAGGVLLEGVKEGKGETFEPDKRYGEDTLKFYTFFKAEEITNSLENAGFTILEVRRVHQPEEYLKGNAQLRIHAKKPFNLEINSESKKY